MKKLTMIFLTVIVLSQTNCSGNKTNKGVSTTASIYTQSCRDDATHLCYDFTSVETPLKSECSASFGTYVESPCPTANRVGTCEVQYSGYAVRYYSAGSSGWTLESAQNNCNAGPFTPN
ncbi:hypothetical protein [Bdellovibrio sp. HCB-110]|uniref:hypothetical protein n=1 Tax=Bdellovibrio sp. HCB-110 TaxID=3391182 RepID=UPI0039B3D0C8